MTQILSTIKKSGRAAIVALSLAAASFTGMPAAQAQSFNFEFGIQGGGNNFSYGFDRGRRIQRECLTDREIRRGLERQGWNNVRLVDRRGVRIKVVADWRRTSYAMTINRCTGRVSDIERLRRSYHPGFNFQFRF